MVAKDFPGYMYRHMGVSKNGGTPKKNKLYNGKPY